MATGTAEVNAEQPAQRGGMLWGAIFTLVPYGLIAITIGLWALGTLSAEPTIPCSDSRPFGLDCTFSPRGGALFVLAVSVPFATLATGLAWLVVLGMGLTRARRWGPALRGGVAAGFCWLVTGVTLLVWS